MLFVPENQNTQKLGDILLKGKLINEEQLIIAQKEHQLIGGKFGSTITSLSYTTEKSIIFFLYRKIFVKKKKREINLQLEKMLGEFLVSYRIISLKDLANVIEFQQSNNIKLGYALSQLNIIDEKSLLDALKHQLFNTKEFVSVRNKQSVAATKTINKTKKPISIYIPIFVILFLAIVLIPIWYYFSGYDDTVNIVNDDVVNPAPTSKIQAKNYSIEEEIIQIENELRFAMSLNKESKNNYFESETINNDSKNYIEKDTKQAGLATEESIPAEEENLQDGFSENDIAAEEIESDTLILNEPKQEELTTVETFSDETKNVINIKNIRYFSDNKTATFVFDSDKNLNNSFIRSYLRNQNMKFEFNNSIVDTVSIKNGDSDKLIENFNFKTKKDSSGFVIRYRMKHAGTSLYHVLKPNKQNPLYRLVVVVRPAK